MIKPGSSLRPSRFPPIAVWHLRLSFLKLLRAFAPVSGGLCLFLPAFCPAILFDEAFGSSGFPLPVWNGLLLPFFCSDRPLFAVRNFPDGLSRCSFQRHACRVLTVTAGIFLLLV